MNAKNTHTREVFFEFHPSSGRAVRVVAIDAATGTEVVMVGDSKMSNEILKRTAARKLMYVLNKNKDETKR